MDQAVVFVVLAMALVLFAWGRIRHDFVALLALFAVVLTGIVEPGNAFEGFSHPAVITVAAVLVIGRGLERSGLIDILARSVVKVGHNPSVQVLVLCLIVAFASAFMNNVGALAVVMPVAIHVARKSGRSPSYILMPVAFASLLGGMTTLIGTPPNIIISAFRAEAKGEPFAMFDYAFVGLPLALAGIFFLTLVGWRLLPKREAPRSTSDLFDISNYITEVEVVENSPVVGKTLIEFTKMAGVPLQVLGIIRRETRIHAPDPREVFEIGDMITIEIDADELKTLVENTKVCLLGECHSVKTTGAPGDIIVTEAVVMANSALIGRSVADIQLRRRHRINLLAVARKESQIHRRLIDIVFQNGDVLLLQGREAGLYETMATLGCLPLAPRGLSLGYQQKIPLTLGIFGIAIGVVVAGWLSAALSFCMAAVAMVLTGVLPMKEVYRSIDWPIIVLLGAMIPVGLSLETTGGAESIARLTGQLAGGLPVWALLAVVIVITMFMSDIINNAATCILMAPIALGVAHGFGYNPDSFLMAVAYGGSSAFLTPIGHQSNTLVMSPGGYRFTDYWKVGLPLEIILVVIGVPLILWAFPV